MDYPIKLQFRSREEKGWENIVLLEKESDWDEMDYQAYPLFDQDTEPYQEARLLFSDGESTEIPMSEIFQVYEEKKAKLNLDMMTLSSYANNMPKNAVEVGQELLQEAWMAKTYAIHPRSKVRIDIEGLWEIELTESKTGIHLVFMPSKQADLSLHADINAKSWTMTMHYEMDVKLVGFLYLLAASIIRDLWVCENKDYDSTKKTTREQRKGKRKRKKPIIHTQYIYVPRFKIEGRKYDSSKSIRDAVRTEISPHRVIGHPRKLPQEQVKDKKAREKRLEIARQRASKFDIRLPEGHTFVGPYAKGSVEEQMKTFKSKSALKLLFSAN